MITLERKQVFWPEQLEGLISHLISFSLGSLEAPGMKNSVINSEMLIRPLNKAWGYFQPGGIREIFNVLKRNKITREMHTDERSSQIQALGHFDIKKFWI